MNFFGRINAIALGFSSNLGQRDNWPLKHKIPEKKLNWRQKLTFFIFYFVEYPAILSMKKIFFSATATVIYFALQSSLSGSLAGTKPAKSSNSFDKYHQECLQRVTKQGLAADVAKDVCNCTMTKFKGQYNIQQFKAIVQKSKTDKTSARQLSKVGETCFEKVLYEE